MISKARTNADNSVDAIISNCGINLSPNATIEAIKLGGITAPATAAINPAAL